MTRRALHMLGTETTDTECRNCASRTSSSPGMVCDAYGRAPLRMSVNAMSLRLNLCIEREKQVITEDPKDAFARGFAEAIQFMKDDLASGATDETSEFAARLRCLTNIIEQEHAAAMKRNTVEYWTRGRHESSLIDQTISVSENRVEVLSVYQADGQMEATAIISSLPKLKRKQVEITVGDMETVDLYSRRGR